jgi:hypothetical protein
MALPARSEPVHLGVQSLTIETAIDHLVDAAQGVVENQLELAKLEVELTASRVMSGAAVVAVGVFLLIGAVATVAMAAYVMMPAVAPEQRLGLIAAVCAVLGIGLTMLGVRRVRGDGGH